MTDQVRRPNISEMINNTRNIKNNTFAIPAAAEATPPKPNTAAIIATIKKIIDHLSIIKEFKGL